MAISEDLPETRELLEDTSEVDASRISVEAEGDVVVLLATVATANQADSAMTVAVAHVPSVENQLDVDEGLREEPR